MAIEVTTGVVLAIDPRGFSSKTLRVQTPTGEKRFTANCKTIKDKAFRPGDSVAIQWVPIRDDDALALKLSEPKSSPVHLRIDGQKNLFVVEVPRLQPIFFSGTISGAIEVRRLVSMYGDNATHSSDFFHPSEFPGFESNAFAVALGEMEPSAAVYRGEVIPDPEEITREAVAAALEVITTAIGDRGVGFQASLGSKLQKTILAALQKQLASKANKRG